MKTILVLSVLLCAAFAAPAEDKEKPVEAAVMAPMEEKAPAPEMEEVMMKEEVVPEDSVPVSMNDVVEEEAASGARFSCPNGWFPYGTRCYMFIHSAKTWHSAEKYCNDLGAHLASANDDKEDNFLQRLTRTAGQRQAWLGGFHLEGYWMWINRDNFYYYNEHFQKSASSPSCIIMSTDNEWSNEKCAYKYRFICSKNLIGC